MFNIYKFRTLEVDAQQRLGARLVSTAKERFETPIGRRLRACRLDELPQLWNVLRGDMTFIGPRPERPEVYEATCVNIPGYRRRFAIKPGLVGFSQVFTPHGAPKRMRTRVDNAFYSRARPWMEDARLLALTAAMVVRHSLVEAGRGLAAALRMPTVGAGISVPVDDIDALLTLPGDGAATGALPFRARVVALDESALTVAVGDLPAIPSGRCALEIRRRLPAADGRERVRRVRCHATVVDVLPSAEGRRLVLAYEPATEVSEYTLQQYILRQGLASCLRA